MGTITMSLTSTELFRGRLLVVWLGVVALLCACGPRASSPPPAKERSWAVTVWGKAYEVFAELDPLTAGRSSAAHVHVTVLDGFAPLAEGTVEVVLRDSAGEQEQVFRSSEAGTQGIFAVEMQPSRAGDFALSFRLASSQGQEEIRGGRLRVGSSSAPGGPLVVPAPRGATEAVEPLAFLKEEQWRSDFATAWVRQGHLSRSVAALARVRAVAGGDAVLTAPIDAVLHPRPWPYPGQEVARGEALFQLVPRVEAGTSLATLSAEAAALAAELATARARLGRLEELQNLEAVSRREVEDLRSRVAILAERSRAAAEDLEAARSAREGGVVGAVTLRAPFKGEMASVMASPGAAVAVGETLARLVQTDPLWLDAAVLPRGARLLGERGLAGVVATTADKTLLRFDAENARLISVAPEIDPTTGRVSALIELGGSYELALGSVLEAQLLLSDFEEGVVLPATAVIDDGGNPVAYLQLAGERFIRQPLRVEVRQGDQVLVSGLVPGQRVVTRGGEAIRRSSLMASGQAHGHVH